VTSIDMQSIDILRILSTDTASKYVYLTSYRAIFIFSERNSD